MIHQTTTTRIRTNTSRAYPDPHLYRPDGGHLHSGDVL